MTSQNKWTIRLTITLLLIVVLFNLATRVKAQDEMPILEQEYTHYMPSIRNIPETQLGLGPAPVVKP